MSKKNYIRQIVRELQKVNDKIDLRILRGLSYAELAKQHSRLRELVALYS